jgi:hypothetical protein
LNTRTLLDPPYQGSADHTAVPRPVEQGSDGAFDQRFYDDVVIRLCAVPGVDTGADSVK